MIYFIIIAALLVGVALMNEYGWADLTGSNRNNVVFETRNKSYGAYEIRQKYSNRLIVAFFGSMGILTLAAFSPKFFVSAAKQETVAEPKGPKITTMVNKKEEPKKEEEIRENKVEKQEAAPKKQDVSTVAANKPIPTDTKQQLDTVQKPKDAIVSNVTHTGKDSGAVVNPVIPVGTGGGGDCLDCPENIIKSGGSLTVATVTKQAEFDYQNFFRKNLRIPEMVYDLGINKTKVYVDFVLDEEGNVTKVKIRKGEIPVLNDEVQRVAASMPKWSPAEYNEHKVKVRMTIPVSITLK